MMFSALRPKGVFPVLFALFTLLQVRSACSQVFVEDPSMLGRPISEIEITGNRITQEEIILREMKLRPGVATDEEKLETDLLRVQSLDIFSRVEFHLISRQERPVLRIAVTEEWYIFPMPFWELTDDTPPEAIYGFRYFQKNFRGRDETIIANLWSGADRGFRFFHNNPWMTGTPALSRSVNLYQSTQSSRRLAVKDLDLEERHTVAEVGFGKRWRLELTSEIGAKFRLIQAENPLQLATNGELDRILEAQILAIWDGRDLSTFPRRGLYIETRFINGWILNGSDRYQRLSLDLRTYIPYKNVSLCSRFLWQPGMGNVPPYDWIIVEETSPIRSSKLSDEGESFLFASLEMRMELYHLRYFTWHGAPHFKQYFRNLKYGLAGELFLDVGDAYQTAKTPTMSSLMGGFGAGLLLRVPYVDVIRLETSWNPEYSFRDARFSWRLGVSF